MPPWNWLTGHLPFLRAHFSLYPPEVLVSLAMKDIYRENFITTEVFYLDSWLFVAPTRIPAIPRFAAAGTRYHVH